MLSTWSDLWPESIVIANRCKTISSALFVKDKNKCIRKWEYIGWCQEENLLLKWHTILMGVDLNTQQAKMKSNMFIAVSLLETGM